VKSQGWTWEPQAQLAAPKWAARVGRLHCVDPDVVELSNLCRQVLYAEADVGAPKAEAAVARLQ
jgi:molybdopterin/thiamine biosynthesis adenylyltransferase